MTSSLQKEFFLLLGANNSQVELLTGLLLFQELELWEAAKAQAKRDHEEDIIAYKTVHEQERKRLLQQWEKYKEETEAENKRKLDESERAWRRKVQDITVSAGGPKEEMSSLTEQKLWLNATEIRKGVPHRCLSCIFLRTSWSIKVKEQISFPS